MKAYFIVIGLVLAGITGMYFLWMGYQNFLWMYYQNLFLKNLKSREEI